MNIRLSSALSVALHLTLLALLSLVAIKPRKIAPPPSGMEIEIVDREHAIPLPDPALANRHDTDMPEQPRDAVASPVQSVPRSPAEPSAASAPMAWPAPPHPPQLQPVAPKAPASAPPVPPAPAPTRAALPVPSPPAAPPAAHRLDTASLARSLGQTTEPGPRPRLNSATIGSAIGRAVPKGVAGLTIRQRTDLADMIRSQITPCWNPPQAEDNSGHVTILMGIRLGRDGNVLGAPALVRVGGQTAANGAYANALAGSVRRAILRCAPLHLPPELYDAWADIELNFDPRDIS